MTDFALVVTLPCVQQACHGLSAGHLHGWPSAGTTMEARGSLRRPFWDSSPLMTPIIITWTIPGHFYLVRAVPGAVPTAAASMDGSDGRPDGSPGVGKGLSSVRRALSEFMCARSAVLTRQCGRCTYVLCRATTRNVGMRGRVILTPSSTRTRRASSSAPVGTAARWA